MKRTIKTSAVLSLFLATFSLSLFLLQEAAISLSNEASKESPTELSAPPTGQFIQEPVQRSSKRPSFWEQKRPSLSYKRRVSPLVLGSVSDSMGNAWKSAVRIMHAGEQVALGTIVNADGWIITKASQLPNSSSVICAFEDFQEKPAQVIRKLENLDIALLRVNATDLHVAQWASEPPKRGNFVATLDLKNTPSSLGVISAGMQSIPKVKPILGVNLVDSDDGAAVTFVLRGSGAARAGLKLGDNIYEVNGTPVKSHNGFKAAIKNAKGGELVSLKVSRGSNKLSVEAQLMDLALELRDDTEMEVNGALSSRATNFERVLMHDSFLEPNQCGGPLVNLDGKVIGINIARAGRVTSYALPTDAVLPIVNDLIQNEKLVSRNAASSTPQSDEAVR